MNICRMRIIIHIFLPSTKSRKAIQFSGVKLETIVDQNEFLRADGKERKLFFAFKASLVIFKLRKGSNFMLKKSHT